MGRFKVFTITTIAIIVSIVLSIYVPITVWIPISAVIVCIFTNNRKDYFVRIFKRNYTKEMACFLCAFLIINVLFVYSCGIYIPHEFFWHTFVVYIIIYCIQAFSEESLFRGFYFYEFKGNLFLRTFVTSLIFTFAHYLSLLSTPSMVVLFNEVMIRFLFSVVLCICYEKNKSILEVTIFHFVSNFLVLIDANLVMNNLYRIDMLVTLEIAVYCLYLYRCNIAHYFKKIKSLM